MDPGFGEGDLENCPPKVDPFKGSEACLNPPPWDFFKVLGNVISSVLRDD